MQQKGMPVPPGFTITTATARYFMDHDNDLPPEVTRALKEAMTQLERETGYRFGDPGRPLLVSARSGAAASMPAAQSTIISLYSIVLTVSSLSSTPERQCAMASPTRCNSFAAASR